MANIAVNLWGHDLVQQWTIQINIPATSRACISEENITDITDGGNRPLQLYKNIKQLMAFQSHASKMVD